MIEAVVEIGKTKKPHGVKGELKVFVDDAYFEDLMQVKVVFIKVRGTFMPYFVESIRGGQFIILKLEDINTREDALEIGGKELALREADILEDEERTLEVEGLEYDHLVGFEIIDAQEGRVGKIEEIIEMPQQEMAMVRYKKKEMLIPLNDDFIIEVRENSQEVLMDLPEGLLDIF